MAYKKIIWLKQKKKPIDIKDFIRKLILDFKQLKQGKKIVTKSFVRQLDLNFIIPKLNFLIKKNEVLRGSYRNSNLLNFKTIFYILVKKLKILRSSKVFFEKEEAYDKLILNLHRSRFYYSFKEVLKKDHLFFLKRFHLLPFFAELIKKNKKNYAKRTKLLIVGRTFNKFFHEEIFSLKDTNKLLKKGEDMVRFSTNRKDRRFLPVKRSIRLRFVLAQVRKKKLKFLSDEIIFKNLIRLKLSSFKNLPVNFRFNLFKFRKLKFKVLKKLKKYEGRRRRFKKWKRYKITIIKRGKIVKRFKKRIIHPFFRYYRNRHRGFSRFYIPRYLEINYKTFSFIHLNSKEFSGMSYRIPFYLNLGTLLTFISL